jgi:hypothetical protein
MHGYSQQQRLQNFIGPATLLAFSTISWGMNLSGRVIAGFFGDGTGVAKNCHRVKNGNSVF